MKHHNTILKTITTALVVGLTLVLSVLLVACPASGGSGSGGSGGGGSTPLPRSSVACTDVTGDTVGSTSLTVSNVVLEVGEGRVPGARQLAAVTGVPSGERLVVKRVTRGSTALRASEGEHYFYALGNNLRIGIVQQNSDKSGCIEPSSNNVFKQAAGTYTVTLACEGCADKNVTVEVRNVIALFKAVNPGRSAGGWQGNFASLVTLPGIAARADVFCDAYMRTTHSGDNSTDANALTAQLKNDGFTALNGSKAAFFGSVGVRGNSNIIFHFKDITTDAQALNMPNSANGAARNVHVYKVSSGSASVVKQFNSQAVTLGDLLDITNDIGSDIYANSSGDDGTADGQWSVKGQSAITELIPLPTSGNHRGGESGQEPYNFWSFSGRDDRSGNPRRLSVVGNNFYYSTANRLELADDDSNCTVGTSNASSGNWGRLGNAWQIDGGIARRYNSAFASLTASQYELSKCSNYAQVLCVAK